jgi:prefoldin alpha subunit
MAQAATEYQLLLEKFYRLQVQAQAELNKLNQVESLLEGLSLSTSVIKELENAKPNQNIVLPIGNSAYIKANIPDPKNVIISFGRRTLVERDSKNALDFLRKQQELLKQQREKTKKNISDLSIILKQTESELEKHQQFKPPSNPLT